MLLGHDVGHRNEGRAVVRAEARPDGAADDGLVPAHEVFRDEVGVFAVGVLALEGLVAVVLEVRVDDRPVVALHERAADRARADVQRCRGGVRLDQVDDDALGVGRRRRTVQLLQVQVARPEEGEKVVCERTEGFRSDRGGVVLRVLAEDDREEVRERLFHRLEVVADERGPREARGKPGDLERVDLVLDAAAAEENGVEGALVEGRAANREEVLCICCVFP
mmetsp:Transcript_9238/g.28350  ORF Transcript_9238/g.28350 Transcript_9238/m.28350 type:complete len:222 (-) Transcript_9238:317-982(-)